MALVQIDLDPEPASLRRFACLWAPLFGGLAGAFFLWGGLPVLGGSLWAIAALTMALGALSTTAVRPLYLVLILVTAPIGFLVSHLVLMLVYFGVVTPVGLALRALGRDPLERARNPGAATYLRERGKMRALEEYFRQF